MTYDEAIHTINSLLRFGVKPGLERMEALLHRLGDPQKTLRFVHVAGTNGKGSTCAMLACVLSSAGYKTGRFTSPYVADFRERMQIDDRMIPKETLAALTDEVLPEVEAMEREGETVTEFEMITALALLWFARERCEIVVLEVGLGGRFDATNVIDCPLVSVITSISFDHMAILGNSLAKIAFEKCGILKEGGVTVCAPCQPEEARKVIKHLSKERGCEFLPADLSSLYLLGGNLNGTEFIYRGQTMRLPLLGDHQLQNAVTALTALEVLRKKGFRITLEHMRSGLARVAFPARLELLSRRPVVLLDGAHNPGGAAVLAEALRKYLSGKKIIAIMGMMADKDRLPVFEKLMPLFSEVFACMPSNPRALSAAALASEVRNFGLRANIASTPAEALERALGEAGEGDAVVICGSLFLAADIRPRALELLKK